MYRAGLHGTFCTSCQEVIRHGADRVNIRPTWRDHPDVLCVACWYKILEAADLTLTKLYLDQLEFAEPDWKAPPS